MPKRSTLTFSSEDAPPSEEDPLHVYYCKYSGQHCFITDASLSQLPRRRTDGSFILDTKKYIVRVSLKEQAPKLIKRSDGVEKQIRFHTNADLPVCYRSEPGGQFLYVLPDAVTAYTDAAAAAERKAPVPPCIQRVRGGGVQVTVSLEDKARECALLGVMADEVKFSVTTKADHCATELLDLLGKILHVRLPQLSLLKGLSTRSKTLVVNGMSPQQVFDRLQMHMAGAGNQGRRTHGGAIPNVMMPPPPPRQAPADQGAEGEGDAGGARGGHGDGGDGGGSAGEAAAGAQQGGSGGGGDGDGHGGRGGGAAGGGDALLLD